MYYRTFILLLILAWVCSCHKKDEIDLEIKEHQETSQGLSEQFDQASVQGTYTLSGIDYKAETGKAIRIINRNSQGSMTFTDSTYQINYQFLTASGEEFTFQEKGSFSIISYHEIHIDNRSGITPYGTTYHFASIDKFLTIRFSPLLGNARIDTLKIGPGAIKNINKLIFYDGAPVNEGQLRLKWKKH